MGIFYKWTTVCQVHMLVIMQNRTETGKVSTHSILPSHSTHPYLLITDRKILSQEGNEGKTNKQTNNYAFYSKNKEHQVDLNRLRPIKWL